jgi:hypothetical protein
MASRWGHQGGLFKVALNSKKKFLSLQTIRRAVKNRCQSLGQAAMCLLRPAMRRKQHSVLDLQGLGKDIWSEENAVDFVKRERDGWD